MVNNWLNIVQHLQKVLLNILQDTCIICYQTNKSDYHICQDCYDCLPWIDNACTKCALPLDKGNSQCGKCLRGAGAVDNVVALFRYEEPIKNFVHQLKYKKKLYYAKILAYLFASRFKSIDSIDVILPVPLAIQRLKDRGYNQSLELCKSLSHKISIPVFSKVLIKQRETKSQSSLSKEQRLRNVRSSDFQLTSPVKGKRVLIVDDVYTTGTTINCLAKMLKKNGAESVDAVVICRAL